MKVEGRIFKEHKQEHILCPECGKDLAKGSLLTQSQTQHGVGKGGLVSEGGETDRSDRGNNPITYRMAFPARAETIPCPVKGCCVRAFTKTATRVHSWHRNVRDALVILEDRNLPHPQCPLYDILVPWRDLNWTHRRTSHCNRGAISSGRVEGGHHQGFQRRWALPGDGDLLQIPGMGDLGNRKLLAGGGE